ncbi:MAG: hypothetical protein ACREVJ_00110, partial [Gammaproteobacteria bacterium]
MFERPEPTAKAWHQISAWLAAEVAWILQATERHRDVLGTLLTTAAGVQANLVPDAHLGALAIEHGLLLQRAEQHEMQQGLTEKFSHAQGVYQT